MFPLVIKVDPLDQVDTPAIRRDRVGYDREHLRQELVGRHKHEQRGSRTGLRQIRNGHDVVREGHARQVPDIFVFVVDEVREVTFRRARPRA